MIQTVSALAVTSVILTAFAASAMLATILGMLTEIAGRRRTPPTGPVATPGDPRLFLVPPQRAHDSAEPVTSPHP